MNYYIENENLLTSMLRYGEVENFSACKKVCNAKNMHPFQMRDFYNFADQLNQTNFLFHKNQTTENQTHITADLRTVRIPIFQTDENFELCTNVQYDFERRIWTDGSALDENDLKHDWENKFGQLWVGRYDFFTAHFYHT